MTENYNMTIYSKMQFLELEYRTMSHMYTNLRLDSMPSQLNIVPCNGMNVQLRGVFISAF